METFDLFHQLLAVAGHHYHLQMLAPLKDRQGGYSCNTCSNQFFQNVFFMMALLLFLNFFFINCHQKPRRLGTVTTLPWVSCIGMVPKARLSTAVVRLSPRTNSCPLGTFSHREGSPSIEQRFFIDILLLLRRTVDDETIFVYIDRDSLRLQ